LNTIAIRVNKFDRFATAAGIRAALSRPAPCQQTNFLETGIDITAVGKISLLLSTPDMLQL
jgi:hypothetical protein